MGFDSKTVQKHVNLVDLVKSFPTNIYLQNLASIQKRTSPVKFAHLAEKSGKGSISNLSTKVPRAPSTVVSADGTAFEAIAPVRLAGFVFVTVLRVAVAVVLLVTGIFWLTATLRSALTE